MDFRNYTDGQELPEDVVELNAVYASLADYLNRNVGQQLQYKDLMNRILVKAMGAVPAVAASRPVPVPAPAQDIDDPPPYLGLPPGRNRPLFDVRTLKGSAKLKGAAVALHS